MRSLLFIFFVTIALSMCALVVGQRPRLLNQMPIKYSSENKGRYNHSAYVDQINEAIQPYCGFASDEMEESMMCSGDMTIDVFSMVFKNMSAVVPDDLKNFQRLYLAVSYNTLELNDNAFSGLLFEELFVSLGNKGYVNFTVNQSQNIYASTRMFYVAYLTSYSINFNEDFEEVLKHFTELRSLIIVKWLSYPTEMLVNLSKNFFDNFPQLSELQVSTGTIVGLEPYTFWNTNMHDITFANTADWLTKRIPEYGFAHNNTSNETLTIILQVNGMLAGAFLYIDGLFPTDSLVGINRPTSILISEDIEQSYIPENSFQPFFLENENNTVGFYKPYFGLDCEACRNYWVQQYNFTSRIDEKCVNGNELADENNWSTCHGM